MLGKINIKFPVDTTGKESIGFSQIKLYDGEKEVTTLNNSSDSVTVKSDEKDLEELLIEECAGCQLSPEFKSDLTVYNLITTTDSIKINAKARGNATVSGSGVKDIFNQKETIEIVVTSEAGNTKKYKINVTKTEPKSDDNSLKSMTIDSGTLQPDFSSNITSCTATVDKTEVTIDAVANHENATIAGIGKKELKYGKNEFDIIITAEDGTTKNYLVVINRPDTRNANAYLKELTIDGQDIGFEKDIVEYNYTVGIDVVDLNINAIPEQETSGVSITGNRNLAIGENEVIITVQAEDNSVKEYKIIVVRKELEREEVVLKTLKIQGYNISFEQFKFEYSIVINGEKELDIVALPNNEKHIVEILGNENLKEGSIIKIIVSNSNYESNVYKIKIESDIALDDNVVDNEINGEINYVPIIMTSLLVILAILNVFEIVKRIRKK